MEDKCTTATTALASGMTSLEERMAHIETQINRQSSESSTAAVPETVLNNQLQHDELSSTPPRPSVSSDQQPETIWRPTMIREILEALNTRMSCLERRVFASDFSSNAAASRPDSGLLLERLDQAFNERMATLQSLMGDLALSNSPNIRRDVSDSSREMNSKHSTDDNNSVTCKETEQFQTLIDMIAAQGNSLTGKYDLLQNYIDANNGTLFDKQKEICEIVRILTANCIPVEKYKELELILATVSVKCSSSEPVEELTYQVSVHTSQLRDISNKLKDIDVKFAEVQKLIEMHEKRISPIRATQGAFATDLLPIRAMADECMHYKSSLEKQAEIITNELKSDLLQVMKAIVADSGNTPQHTQSISIQATASTALVGDAAEDTVDNSVTINADNEYAVLSTPARRNKCEPSSEYLEPAACLQTHELHIPASNHPHAEMHRIKCVVAGDDLDEKTDLFTLFRFYPTDKGCSFNAVPDMCAMDLLVDGVEHRLELWDTSGQEDYDQLRTILYRKTDVFIVLFSTSKPSSFLNVKSKWVPEIHSHCPNIPIVLVGCNTDLRRLNTAAVSTKEGEQCATDIKAASYIECGLNMIDISKMLRKVVKATTAVAGAKKRGILGLKWPIGARK